MKLSLSSIQEFIDVNLPPHKIAEMLTLAGLEVDGFASLPQTFEKVVVAEVLEAAPHPDAETLQVAIVSNGEETFQVVCGAPNCRKGLRTAFAQVGGRLTDPDGKVCKIKKGKLRGVESFGMLCSEQELGIGDDASGIVEFEAHLALGSDVAEIYGDTIFEISLTPNLGHCWSVLGVARELHAATGIPFKIPLEPIPDTIEKSVETVTLQIEDPDKCPRYACRVVRGVKVLPSPQWLQSALNAFGMRPVNNVVDATNYVLMKFGHPLHAFDYAQILGKTVIVRDAKEGEKFETLDGKTCVLAEQDLLICDAERPIAIAGVMGGANSEVSESTVDLLLESAYFDPVTVRCTSKRLGLQTDASKHFERGTDRNGIVRALNEAAALICRLTGGAMEGEIRDSHPEAFPRNKVHCRLSFINKILGAQLSLSEVERVFERLEMEYKWDGQDQFTVLPPTYRNDVTTEIDLVEEVARIHGFDNLPKVNPKYTTSTLSHAPIYLFENSMRRRMIAAGLQEMVTCDLIGPSLLDMVGEAFMAKEATVEVLNPTSVEQSILRTSLLPGLLQVVKHNYDHQRHSVKGFEIGRSHFKDGEQFLEQSLLGIILTGSGASKHWGTEDREVDFFDLKGMIEGLLDALGITTFSVKNLQSKILHPGRQAALDVEGMEIGSFGEVHPAILRRLDLPQKVFFAEIDLHNLFKVKSEQVRYRPLPIYPSSSRDVTLTLNRQQQVADVLTAIQAIPSRLLESVTVVDLYEGKELGADHVNVTFHFVYRNQKKTVAQEAVDAEHARIITEIEKCIGR